MQGIGGGLNRLPQCLTDGRRNTLYGNAKLLHVFGVSGHHSLQLDNSRNITPAPSMTKSSE